MVSDDVDQIKGFFWKHGLDKMRRGLDTLSPLFQEWISEGGVAADGIRYAPPTRAVAWGHRGCPLLPRELRENHEGIRLPHDLEEVLEAPLTVDQLDSSVLDRLSFDDVLQLPTRAFRDFLYSMPVLNTQVAIPAGIPLAWLEELPISGRAHSAVRSAFRKAGTTDFLPAPMFARQILAIRSVGISTLNELLCVIESAELGCTDEEPTIRLGDTAPQQAVPEHEGSTGAADIQIIGTMSAFNGHILEFARWSKAETDAETFGEAIAELIRVGAANEVWKAVASISLSDLVVDPPHPYELLDKWMEQLDPRSRAIFMGRISGYIENFLTLEELGAGFGVTRERIRQVEIRVRRALGVFLESEEALPVRWRAATLRQTIKVAAPTHTVDYLLRSPSGCNDHRDILLEMAGPYDREDDWLTLRSAQKDDPTSAILAQVDEVGRINREIATVQLTYWGLDVSLHERWLTRDGSVRLFNGQLVRWGTTISDRLAFALSEIGRSATVDEMVAHVEENRSRYSISNALSTDPRIVRVSRTHWGLASWGRSEYSGVAESMRKLLEESGKPMSIDEMVRSMYQAFGVEESTTLTYCSAPLFIVEGQRLRLRTPDDEPHQFDPDLIRRTQGVFWLGPMRLGRLFKVDANMLRGSGTILTQAAGAVLEVDVNASLSFTNRDGDQVQVTFPETSLVGPSVGSVRRIAERLSAKEGDYLTLVLDGSDLTVTATVTYLSNESPGWQAISRLTGIAAPADLESLAKALLCQAREVRSVLRARGDDEILDYLPKSDSTTSLEEALAALEEQVESVRGDSQ